MSEVTTAQQKENIYLDTTGRFQQAVQASEYLSKSDMVPQSYRNKPSNCMIALNMAHRFNMDPMLVMQNTSVIHGRPSFDSKFKIALINGSGKLKSPLNWEFEGEGDARRCTCYATLHSGERIEQSITMKEAKDWGWVSKNGSAWQKSPDLMMRYRTASWIGNTYFPDVTLGIHTREEVQEIVYKEKESINVTPPPPPKAAQVVEVVAEPAPPLVKKVGINTQIKAMSEHPALAKMADNTLSFYDAFVDNFLNTKSKMKEQLSNEDKLELLDYLKTKAVELSERNEQEAA